MSKEKLNRIIDDVADAFSSDYTSSVEYLKSNDVDIDTFVARGLAELLPTKEISSKKRKLSKSANYFRRVVLAAEIANKCYSERTFGRVKFQKLLYLCEQVSDMPLQTNYTKQAAGPFDNKFMHTITSEFKKKRWFNVEKIKDGKYTKVNYTPLEDIGGYKKYYENYYSTDNSKIQFIISLFHKSKTREVELVATIYACWQEIISKGEKTSDELIIKYVYDWAKEKKKFSQKEIINKISWMKEKGLIPSTKILTE